VILGSGLCAVAICGCAWWYFTGRGTLEDLWLLFLNLLEKAWEFLDAYGKQSLPFLAVMAFMAVLWRMMKRRKQLEEQGVRNEAHKYTSKREKLLSSAEGEKEEVEETFPAQEFFHSATKMCEGILEACDSFLKLCDGGANLLKKLEDPEVKSAFDENLEGCKRHCASLVTSYGDLEESIFYKEEQQKLTRKLSTQDQFVSVKLGQMEEEFDEEEGGYKFKRKGKFAYEGQLTDAHEDEDGYKDHPQNDDSDDNEDNEPGQSEGWGPQYLQEMSVVGGGSDYSSDDDWKTTSFGEMEEVLKSLGD